jgi:hypothetical protein
MAFAKSDEARPDANQCRRCSYINHSKREFEQIIVVEAQIEEIFGSD